MGKRTRIINDPSELVPLLRTFGSRTNKNVFDALSTKWMTEEELNEYLGKDSSNSILLLKKSGLIESQWKMPEPGKKPSMEYHTSYSKVQTNFQCSFEDLSDIIMLAFKPYEEVSEAVEELEKLVSEGNQSMSNLTRILNRSPLYIRAVARRSPKIAVMGQRLKISEEL
ncbi:ArsR family transcriptional regulator [Methanosalsum natronophilum]|uniref:ArsR family transcriptional regulator n=1 Tax=Methanosalsum natronophilum TaxID=768733 RepID=A0A424Z4E0_9EURY|nr:ArsR family transcriptional regulator [Methanosalsum natronophilum]MCS3924297.1 putative DNA-binding ArsR family transcriptional regulator [Methanosalsum natronophilum]RQD91879.1 MAG: ArsR family transcriptional regulator [Methanosalsum natronophilum]